MIVDTDNFRSTVSPKSRGVNYYLECIRLTGWGLDCIKVVDTAGDIRPPYPFQFIAIGKLRNGDDDPPEGIGGTVIEALRNLLDEITGWEGEVEMHDNKEPKEPTDWSTFYPKPSTDIGHRYKRVLKPNRKEGDNYNDPTDSPYEFIPLETVTDKPSTVREAVRKTLYDHGVFLVEFKTDNTDDLDIGCETENEFNERVINEQIAIFKEWGDTFCINGKEHGRNSNYANVRKRECRECWKSLEAKDG